jgi:hypothetical protein
MPGDEVVRRLHATLKAARRWNLWQTSIMWSSDVAVFFKERIDNHEQRHTVHFYECDQIDPSRYEEAGINVVGLRLTVLGVIRHLCSVTFDLAVLLQRGMPGYFREGQSRSQQSLGRQSSFGVCGKIMYRGRQMSIIFSDLRVTTKEFRTQIVAHVDLMFYSNI